VQHRTRPPVLVTGIDEAGRRKGQVDLTVAYDLGWPVLLWVGEDRAEEAPCPHIAADRSAGCRGNIWR
jgi:hypothetical protein